LPHDLSCTGTGLSIVGDGITLDLRGRTISGDGTGTGVVVVGNSRVTNGLIVGFGNGVATLHAGAGGGHSMLDNLTVAKNGTGIFLFNQGATITQSVAVNNTGAGIWAVKADRSVFSGNVVTKNGGDGILIDDSSSLTMNNTVLNNAGNGIYQYEEFFLPAPGFEVISRNMTNGNGGLGIKAC